MKLIQVYLNKPSLRSNHTESNIEEDIDMKNQYKITKIPCPQKN